MKIDWKKVRQHIFLRPKDVYFTEIVIASVIMAIVITIVSFALIIIATKFGLNPSCS